MHNIPLKEQEFRQFQTLVHQLSGISLTDSKRQLVKSRLQMRISHYGFSSYQQYYEYVANSGNNEEITTLINCMTTNKSSFFREPRHFDFVRDQFVPELLERVRRGAATRRLRVWHAGCSTGEEPYTMAMVLLEALANTGLWDIRLLASDIDTDVLAHAEAGIYDMEKAEDIPANMLRKYFLRGCGKNSGKVQAKESLRKIVAFRKINLVHEKWPIRSDVKFDLLFCRNVVIYFDRQTQMELFTKFAEKLRPGGHLFIGHSESLFNISDEFLSLGNTIYQLPGDLTHKAKQAAL